jgi:hypothetical protein
MCGVHRENFTFLTLTSKYTGSMEQNTTKGRILHRNVGILRPYRAALQQINTNYDNKTMSHAGLSYHKCWEVWHLTVTHYTLTGKLYVLRQMTKITDPLYQHPVCSTTLGSVLLRSVDSNHKVCLLSLKHELTPRSCLVRGSCNTTICVGWHSEMQCVIPRNPENNLMGGSQLHQFK